jgi:S-adenosylmethionine:tRNA ribosyltransferase-isomerase
MHIAEFDFDLPEELIAQHPLDQRDASRMLVIDRSQGKWADSSFSEFNTHIREGDLVVVNNTRVFPARLVGRRVPSGGQVELFLVKELEPNLWETLSRPARRLQQGSIAIFGEETRITATVIETLDEGRRIVRFESTIPFHEALETIGHTPLPPYIKRTAGDTPEDRRRYQTVFAREKGSIAAPTAGLHFTPSVLDGVKARGGDVAELTLHVGYGTFEPVRVNDIAQHRVSAERYDISPEAAEKINRTKARGGRIIAVGTTTTRTLESAARETDFISAGSGWTDLTITPGFKFRIVDALVSNFHLPRSSLLLLVSAFAGKELTLSAYRHAVNAKYRFYSYGDCMLII